MARIAHFHVHVRINVVYQRSYVWIINTKYRLGAMENPKSQFNSCQTIKTFLDMREYEVEKSSKLAWRQCRRIVHFYMMEHFNAIAKNEN